MKSQRRIDLEHSLRIQRLEVEQRMADLIVARRKLKTAMAEFKAKQDVLDLIMKEYEGLITQLNARLEMEIEFADQIDELETPKVLAEPI